MSTLTTRFIPAKVTNSPWLTIVLHGLGDSMDGYIWMPHVLDMPWMNYLLVNAPDPYFQGFSWYDIFGENPTIGINRSRKLLLELLAEMQKNGFPLEKTYLFGFSQGCLMVLETGFQCSRKLAGIVGISGYVEDLEKFNITPIIGHSASKQKNWYNKFENEYYGTLYSELEKYYMKKNCVLIVDPFSICRVRELDFFKAKNTKTFFLDADDKVLASRLKKRGESEENINRKLLRAKEERRSAPCCDYVVFVEGLDEVVDKIFMVLNRR